MNVQHVLLLITAFLSLAFGGCGASYDDTPSRRTTDDASTPPDATRRATDSPRDWDLPPEVAAVIKEADRMNEVWQAETKKLNWNMFPAAEKRIRTTTGKVVFETVESRLIVAHHEDGTPRFAIRQANPPSVDLLSPHRWITFGAHEAWTPTGDHVRFYAEGETLFGTWVVTDKNGRTRAEIQFENVDRTGELQSATYYSADGKPSGMAMYDSDNGTWLDSSDNADRLREVQDVIKLVRDCLRRASGVSSNY